VTAPEPAAGPVLPRGGPTAHNRKRCHVQPRLETRTHRPYGRAVNLPRRIAAVRELRAADRVLAAIPYDDAIVNGVETDEFLAANRRVTRALDNPHLPKRMRDPQS
jgi:hypothetical protein